MAAIVGSALARLQRRRPFGAHVFEDLFDMYTRYDDRARSRSQSSSCEDWLWSDADDRETSKKLVTPSLAESRITAGKDIIISSANLLVFQRPPRLLICQPARLCITSPRLSLPIPRRHIPDPCPAIRPGLLLVPLPDLLGLPRPIPLVRRGRLHRQRWREVQARDQPAGEHEPHFHRAKKREGKSGSYSRPPRFDADG
ncbi:hypothetical protein K523DRAFT_79076 [Schizophyllum commune Tattone D]|nr:hypothetical protein K523DRAFT_79076 [Schizophyllum commune Tattone D]